MIKRAVEAGEWHTRKKFVCMTDIIFYSNVMVFTLLDKLPLHSANIRE